MNLSDIFTGPPNPDRWRMLGQYLRGQKISSGPGIRISSNVENGTVVSAAKAPPPIPQQDPPFWPTLTIIAGNPIAFTVSVTKGYVCETLLTAGENAEALNYLLVEHVTGGYPTELGIAIDDAVFVYVVESNTGAIDTAEIVVLTKTTKSENYMETIQNGEYYFKLAELIEVDGSPELKMFMAGSHIYKTSGLTGDVLIEDCSGDPFATPVVDGTLLIRMSFISGKLVALNDNATTRPLAVTTIREQFEPCSYAP